MRELFWLTVVMLGPVLMAWAIAYALMRQRRLHPDEARRDLYKHDGQVTTRYLVGS